MFVKNNIFLFLSILFMVTACQTKEFKAIPTHLSFIASVNIKDSSISFIDTKEQSIVTQWDLEKPFTGAILLPDQETFLIYGKQLEEVYIYNMTSGSLQESWKIGNGIVNVVLSNDSKELFLVDQQKSAVRIFNLSGKEVGSIKVGVKPLDLLQSVDGQYLYVNSFAEGKLSVINRLDREVVRTIHINKSSTGGLVRQNEIWMGGHGSGLELESDVHIYSLDDGSLKDTVKAPKMPVHILENDEGIFILSHGSSMLRKVNKATNEVKSSLQVGSNPFIMEDFDDYLYIASYDSNQVYIVDAENMEVIKPITVGEGPFDFFKRGEVVGDR